MKIGENAFLKEAEKYISSCEGASITRLDENDTPIITLGGGARRIVYSSAADDVNISKLFLLFIKEYYSALVGEAKLFGVPIEYLSKRFSIDILPYVNGENKSYLLNYIKFSTDISAYIEFSSDVSHMSCSVTDKGKRAAADIAGLCGVKIMQERVVKAEGSEIFVTRLEIGLKNLFGNNSAFAAYTHIRQAFFCIPMVI